MKIHHIAYLVKNLNKSEEEFKGLGFEIIKPAKFDKYRNVNISFIKNGEYVVELVEPASEESKLYSLLKRFKNSPYHICYLVDDLEKAIKEKEAEGFSLFEAPQIAPCIDGGTVAFLMGANSGMIELLEIKE
ncbi:MAG: VOC family protein [Clostridia bacterium]|nr:VOC family protein [Clostridia bacterium]